ncbi:MAG TPA: ETX/MTX2 family pore-forming toxin [Ktedonobacteraceae bacterium]|nr:ETX/MTX2 family pore-forming toxin [Ktedonobacteraceae bacterium]
MAIARATTVVDLDAHIREVEAAEALKTFTDSDEVRNMQLDYSEVRFDSQINYLLDQLNPGEQMDTIDQLEQSNNTSQIQPMQIRRYEEVKNSYTWTSEHGFSVGVTVSAKIKVPFVGGIDTSVETSYSYTSTESQTEEKTRGWDFTQTVNVAPYTKVIALLMLQKTKPRIPYTLSCTITGNVKTAADLYYRGQLKGYYEYAAPVSMYIAIKPLANFRWEGYAAYFTSSGIFTANEGIKALIDLKETPLQGGRAAEHRIIDVTPGMERQVRRLEQ